MSQSQVIICNFSKITYGTSEGVTGSEGGGGKLIKVGVGILGAKDHRLMSKFNYRDLFSTWVVGSRLIWRRRVVFSCQTGMECDPSYGVLWYRGYHSTVLVESSRQGVYFGKRHLAAGLTLYRGRLLYHSCEHVTAESSRYFVPTYLLKQF